MEGDEQRVRFRAQYPGKLLLHWGVEGGQGYEGGWRLPGDDTRPPGTRSYKNRALQTPMQCALHLTFPHLAPFHPFTPKLTTNIRINLGHHGLF